MQKLGRLENKKGKYGLSSILHKKLERAATTISTLLEIAVGGLRDKLGDVDLTVEHVRVTLASILQSTTLFVVIGE